MEGDVNRNWDLCLLCQSSTSEKVIKPSLNPRLDQHPEQLDTTLRTLIENIKTLKQLDELPADLVIDDLKDVDGEAEVQKVLTILKSNDVVWHRGCTNRLDNQKVKRAELKIANVTAKPSPLRTRIGLSDAGPSQEESPSLVCLICEQADGERLRKAATFGIDTKVRRCASIIGNKKLIRKLSPGDMMAIDAAYHLKCLSQLYRQAGIIESEEDDGNHQTRFLKTQAFADLVDYIELQRGTAVVLKMATIASLYSARLVSLGMDGYVHTTRLRNKVIAAVPDLIEVKGASSRTDLAFDEDISKAMQEMSDSWDSDAIVLVKAAKLLRQHILNMKFEFTGSFSPESEVNSVPPVLLSFQQMMLEGQGIMNKTSPAPASEHVPAAALSISQLIVYNSVKQRSNKPSSIPRHIRDRENPLVIYIAIKIYANTRQESLVDSIHERGLCISYKRLRTMSTDLANSIIRFYEQSGIVVPVQALRGVFTTNAFDNIDHNTRSTTCRTSFHGSCQSVLQFPTPDNPGTKIGPSCILDPEVMGKTGIDVLPESYTVMEEVCLPKDDVIYVPDLAVNSWLKAVAPPLSETLQDAYHWLEHAHRLHQEDRLSTNDWISWAAYYASQSVETVPVTPSFMLPLFRESATSPMMVYHAMGIAKAVTTHLNPGQTPVIVADQPLYTIMKKLQWKYPASHGEDKFVIMLGAMHIEKMLWEMNGTWFNGSGWTTAISNSRVASSGVAESFIGVSHITRTRYMHQVSALTLYILLQQAYAAYLNSRPVVLDDPIPLPVSFEDWVSLQKEKEPQFLYWHRGMELELTTLQFVKSIRTGDFDLFLETIEQLSPWVFALDRTHYKRNLTVHNRDMHALEELHPGIYHEFAQGHFVGQKTCHAFSSIALDQMHEQLIGELKGNSGGVIGLTENPSELRRHLIVGPQLSRLMEEFEQPTPSSDVRHHEQYAKFQSTFQTDVQALVEAFVDLGNPFLEESGQLIELDGSVIMPVEVVNAVKSVTTLGAQQYDDFFAKRICPSRAEKLPWTNPIKKNNLQLLDPCPKSTGHKSVVTTLKEERSKVIQLLLAANSGREINKDVFSHESSPNPPSLSRNGQMFHGTKADILPLLEAEAPPGPSTRPPSDAAVLDGPAIVQLIKPGTSLTIGEYIHAQIFSYLLRWLEHVARLDIIWDIYKPDSLKLGTRESRGTGTRRRVTLQTKVPGNFAGFLRVDANKTELFTLISHEIEKMELEPGKQLISTLDTAAVSTPPSEHLAQISPCHHEEADTRMFVHVADQVTNGYKRVVIRTTDSDVLVIGVSVMQHLTDLCELWLAFGCGKHFRYIPVHTIARQMGNARAGGLPAFHSITGCDTVSSLFGKGKKTAWTVWQQNPDVTWALRALSSSPRVVTDEIFSIQEFVVKLYDLAGCDVDAARMEGFYYKGRDFDHLPPSSDALLQHVRRATYQGGHVWGNSLEPCPAIPDPSDWGWQMVSTRWQPLWISKPVISRALKQLTSCGCTKECKIPCKCCVVGVSCTALCTCRGTCYGKARAIQA